MSIVVAIFLKITAALGGLLLASYALYTHRTGILLPPFFSSHLNRASAMSLWRFLPLVSKGATIALLLSAFLGTALTTEIIERTRTALENREKAKEMELRMHRNPKELLEDKGIREIAKHLKTHTALKLLKEEYHRETEPQGIDKRVAAAVAVALVAGTALIAFFIAHS